MSFFEKHRQVLARLRKKGRKLKFKKSWMKEETLPLINRNKKNKGILWAHTNKLDNLEVDKFLEIYNFPIQNQKEIESLNRPITSKETEPVIKKKKKF